jgi:rhodanese-related sulfurtransferase
MKTILLLTLAACLATTTAQADDAKKSPATATSQAQAYKNVGPEEFNKLRSDKKSVVLDVRTSKEFASGRIPGAVNIDWNSSDFETKVKQLDKSKTYLVHCAGGVRSAKASDKMSKLDFKSVYNLEGGMKAWEKAGKPVEK